MSDYAIHEICNSVSLIAVLAFAAWLFKWITEGEP